MALGQTFSTNALALLGPLHFQLQVADKEVIAADKENMQHQIDTLGTIPGAIEQGY